MQEQNGKKYWTYSREKREVNTDPQRRCYNGAHFSSKWVWGEWGHLGTYSSEKQAIESIAQWKEFQKTSGRVFEYKYEEHDINYYG
jgi:hypothetical protein